MENHCTYYIQHHTEINGTKVWHYLIDTPIAQVNCIAWEETPDGEVKRKLFDGNYDHAERFYYKICREFQNQNGKPDVVKLFL